MTMSNDFIYTTYIKTTAEKVWAAITNPEFTHQYWEHDNVSDWKIGSTWQHVGSEGQVKIIGQVLESVPPKRLVLSWASPTNPTDESRVVFEIITIEDMVRLNVMHGDFKADSTMAGHVAKGWPLVLSSMKSFLETGKALNFWAGLDSDCAK
jgi:uncharacterized protein YndB with AHSA1/START domain